MNKSNHILITGASTGIGYDLCKEFLKRGYSIFGSVRKKSDANKLQDELGTNFKSLIFDVTDYNAVDMAASELESKIGKEGLAGLINNAGIAVPGPVMDLPIEDFEYQFKVNVFGQVKVTQSFLPMLGARENHPSEPGKILQMSSVAGKFGMPFMGPYSGSKHALEGISESLRKELIKFGIDVIVLEPGPIKTPIWVKSTGDVEEKLKDSVYLKSMLKFQNTFMRSAVEEAITSEKAATIMVDIFEKKKPKVRYPIMAGMLKNWYIPKLLPARVIDNYIAKALKF